MAGSSLSPEDLVDGDGGMCSKEFVNTVQLRDSTEIYVEFHRYPIGLADSSKKVFQIPAGAKTSIRHAESRSPQLQAPNPECGDLRDLELIDDDDAMWTECRMIHYDPPLWSTIHYVCVLGNYLPVILFPTFFVSKVISNGCRLRWWSSWSRENHGINHSQGQPSSEVNLMMFCINFWMFFMSFVAFLSVYPWNEGPRGDAFWELCVRRRGARLGIRHEFNMNVR